MSQLYNTMMSHRSIRKYSSKEVSQNLIDKILNAAIRASSSGNMQAYSIIVTRDPQIKKQLYEPHFNQEMVLEAPVLLTFCADFNRMRKWLKISDAPDNFDNFMSFMIAAIDAILVSQNAALAAEAEGLGICFMGTTLASCEQIGRILNCPQNVIPVVGFSLGYPAEAPLERDRLSLGAVVHSEIYQDYSTEALREIYREKELRGMRRYLEIPELRALIENKNISNLAQVYTRAKYTKESHIEYSKSVMTCLQNQGFLEEQSNA